MYQQIINDLLLAIELRTQQLSNAVDLDLSIVTNLKQQETIEVWLEVIHTIKGNETLYTKESLPIGIWFELYDAYGLIGKIAPTWVNFNIMAFNSGYSA